MKVSIVGIGMDGMKTLTAQAREVIENAELLIGAERILHPFEALHKETFISWDADKITAKISESSCESAALLMSGDVGFYSGAKKLLPKLNELPNVSEVRLVCGISSPVYLAAAVGIPWEKMKLVSLHGLDGNIAVNVKLNEFTFFILGGRFSAAELCRRLCDYGLGNTQVTVGTRLGYEDESIVTAAACELSDKSFGSLCSVIVHNSECLRYIPTGIPDCEFERSEVPMTKSEVRAAAVSLLNVCSDSVCWDIGSGSGSVTVELAFRCSDGAVYAVEQKAEAAELTERNARRFSCDNIHVIHGKAPEALETLPVPDKVFIGGSSGRLCEIADIIRKKSPDASVTVTAVSLETLAEAAELIDGDITQLSVTRTRRVGGHTMLFAQNPVYIIKGRIK